MADKRLYVWKKTIGSMAFVVTFIVISFLKKEIIEFWLMLPAFVCCFAGDVLLGFYNIYRRKQLFAMGLLSFLLGHLCFIRWFLRMQPLSWSDFIFPIFAVCLTFYMTSLQNIHTGRLRPCILIYSFFIAMLFSKSFHILVLEPTIFHIICGIGAFLFMISDISILFLYFYRKKIEWIHIFNLTTYYIGIFLLALSPLFL